jgi:hypothetical protein
MDSQQVEGLSRPVHRGYLATQGSLGGEIPYSGSEKRHKL